MGPYGLVALLLAFCMEAEARNRSEARTFRKAHACPATARHTGPCPGYHVDHIVPLCAGGEDKPRNMQWLSIEDHRFKTFIDVRECRSLRRSGSLHGPQTP